MSRAGGTEKMALAAAAAFFLICALRCGLLYGAGEPYRVSTTKQEQQLLTEQEQARWPESLLPGERIDVNTAPSADLARLPQIGEDRARAIAAWREEYGPFQTAGELVKVPGMSESLLEEISGYITLSKTD